MHSVDAGRALALSFVLLNRSSILECLLYHFETVYHCRSDAPTSSRRTSTLELGAFPCNAATYKNYKITICDPELLWTTEASMANESTRMAHDEDKYPTLTCTVLDEVSLSMERSEIRKCGSWHNSDCKRNHVCSTIEYEMARGDDGGDATTAASWHIW